MTKNFVLPRKEKKKRILGCWNGQNATWCKGKSSRVLFPIPVKKRERKIPTYWFLLGSELLYRSRGPWRDASYRWESPGNFRPLVTIRLEGSIEKYLLKSAGIHIITIVRKKVKKKKNIPHWPWMNITKPKKENKNVAQVGPGKPRTTPKWMQPAPRPSFSEGGI